MIPPEPAISSGVRRRAALFLTILSCLLLVAACGSTTPTPATSALGGASVAGGSPSASGPATATPIVLATPTPSVSIPLTPPSPADFWQMAAVALSKAGRMRLILERGEPMEMRFEPKASEALVKNSVVTVCIDRKWYQVHGHQSSAAPGPWMCGSPSLVTSFRRTGGPLEAYNTTLPKNTNIKEVVQLDGKEWRWIYTATAPALGGTVRTTVNMDPASGRLTSGERTDPRGTTKYAFNYTSIFAPVALP